MLNSCRGNHLVVPVDFVYNIYRLCLEYGLHLIIDINVDDSKLLLVAVIGSAPSVHGVSCGTVLHVEVDVRAGEVEAVRILVVGNQTIVHRIGLACEE